MMKKLSDVRITNYPLVSIIDYSLVWMIDYSLVWINRHQDVIGLILILLINQDSDISNWIFIFSKKFLALGKMLN